MNKIYDRYFNGRISPIILAIFMVIPDICFIIFVIYDLIFDVYIDHIDAFISSIFLILVFTITFIVYTKRYIYSMNNICIKIGFGKKSVCFSQIKAIVFVLYRNRRSGYLVPFPNYILYKIKGEKIYASNVFLYLNDNIMFEKNYNYKLNDISVYKNDNPIYDFSCLKFDQLKYLLKESSAKIYVSYSYLYLNKWTINEFARRINVDVDRISLIKDDPNNEIWDMH